MESLPAVAFGTAVISCVISYRLDPFVPEVYRNYVISPLWCPPEKLAENPQFRRLFRNLVSLLSSASAADPLSSIIMFTLKNFVLPNALPNHSARSTGG